MVIIYFIIKHIIINENMSESLPLDLLLTAHNLYYYCTGQATAPANPNPASWHTGLAGLARWDGIRRMDWSDL